MPKPNTYCEFVATVENDNVHVFALPRRYGLAQRTLPPNLRMPKTCTTVCTPKSIPDLKEPSQGLHVPYL